MPPPAASPATSARVGAVIVAAGQSRRMQGIDKLLVPVHGKPLLAYAVEPFQRSSLVDRVVLVLSQESVEEGRRLAKSQGWEKLTALVVGGARRQDSVGAGLQALGPCEWVLVHDGARPCVDEALIERGLEAARETGSAIAAVPAKDTIKVVGPDGVVAATPARDSLWLVQTPQVFRYDIIQRAYKQLDEEATDDASLVEGLGYQVKVFMGSYANIKVTTPEDIATVELFLKSPPGA